MSSHNINFFTQRPGATARRPKNKGSAFSKIAFPGKQFLPNKTTITLFDGQMVSQKFLDCCRKIRISVKEAALELNFVFDTDI